MYKETKIAVLIPAYNEALRITRVLQSVPDYIDRIIVVNDGSTDATADVIRGAIDSRCIFIDRKENKGYGATVIEAYEAALENTDADILVTIDGDGQMDPSYIPKLADPIIAGECHYVKGNRFFSSDSFEKMPKIRIFGNVVLTFLTKVSTGYWSIFDPENGFAALSRTAAEQLDWRKVSPDFSYMQSMLLELALARVCVRNVNIPAIYGQELSSIKLRRVIPSKLAVLWGVYWRRIWMLYVLQSFSPLVLFLTGGAFLAGFSLLFGIWALWQARGVPVMPAASAVLVAVSAISGLQFLLTALVLDIINEPK